MSKPGPDSMFIKDSASQEQPRHATGFFPRIRKKLSLSTDTSGTPSADDKDAQPKSPKSKPEATLDSTGAPSSPTHNDSGLSRIDKATAKENTIRKKRQRRLRKLEHKTDLREKHKRLVTAPGERVFQLPGKVKPISLFIRMGSLASEQDPVPLEYYGSSDDGGSFNVDVLSPHPAALQTKEIFHIGDAYSPTSKGAFVPENTDELAEAMQREESEDAQIIPDLSTANLRPKRPFSIQIPTASALRKADQTGPPKRPRSLRFLDPKDQRLYAAVSHKNFLSQLMDDGRNAELQRSFEEVRIDDKGNDLRRPQSARTADEMRMEKEYEVERQSRRPRKQKKSPASPQVEMGSQADTERSSVCDWNAAETMEVEILPRPKQKPSYHTRSMPILPKEYASGESSDVSGCEADSEERHIVRRGRMARK